MTEQEYEKNRNELKQYIVSLDKDPTSVSLTLLHEKVSIIRGFMDRVRSMLLDARKDVRDKEIALTTLNNAYKKEFNTHLGQDNIKILKTIGQQTAAIELMLIRKLEDKTTAENNYNKATDHFNDIRDSYSDLLNAAKAVRDQIHIIDQQITIGELRLGDLKSNTKARLAITESVTETPEPDNLL